MFKQMGESGLSRAFVLRTDVVPDIDRDARGFAVSIGGSLYSDSLGNPGTPAGSYSGTVRENIETIVSALATAEEGE